MSLWGHKMTKDEQLALTKYDLMFESRLTRVETTCEQLVKEVKEVKTDIRWILGILITFNTTLLGLIAKGFHWI